MEEDSKDAADEPIDDAAEAAGTVEDREVEDALDSAVLEESQGIAEEPLLGRAAAEEGYNLEDESEEATEDEGERVEELPGEEE